MATTNFIQISGNLTKDAELFTSKAGKRKATFTVAHNYMENKEQKTIFINVEAWESKDNTLDILVKGKAVEVKGFIRPLEYTRKDGTKVQSIVIISMEIKEIEFKKKE